MNRIHVNSTQDINSIEELYDAEWRYLQPETKVLGKVIARKLGSGCNGTAYLTTDNTVLKFTCHEFETDCARRFLDGIAPKPLKDIYCDIYRIITHPKNTWFSVIEKEFIPTELDESDLEQKERWRSICRDVEVIAKVTLRDFKHWPNVGIRADGTMVCFDGQFQLQ
jgi:hypothetical protein